MTEPILSTATVAAALGLTEGRVRQLARELRVGRRIGRDHIFTPADLERLRVRRPVGRPKKDA